MEEKKIQSFREQLIRLLSKHCDETTMRKLDSKLNNVRDSEKDLTAQAKKAPENESNRSLIEENFLYQIITECQPVLTKKDFIDLVTEIAGLCVDHGEFATAESLYNNAIETAKDGNKYLDHAAEALLQRANVLLRQARWDLAKVDIKESRRLFTRMKNDVGIGKNENALGIFSAQQGNTKESITHFKKAASLFEKSKKIDLASTSQMNLGIVATIRGKFDEGLTAFNRALTEFESAGDIHRLAELHHNVGMLFLARLEMDSALGQFDESLNYSTQTQYDDLVGLASLGKATVFARTKDFAMAHHFGNKALLIFRKLNAHLSIADTYKVKGIIQRELKHYDAAELYLNTSINLSQRYGSPLNIGEAYLELGLLRAVVGEKAEAKQAFQKSIKSFHLVGAQYSVNQAKAQLGSLVTSTVS